MCVKPFDEVFQGVVAWSVVVHPVRQSFAVAEVVIAELAIEDNPASATDQHAQDGEAEVFASRQADRAVCARAAYPVVDVVLFHLEVKDSRQGEDVEILPSEAAQVRLAHLR